MGMFLSMFASKWKAWAAAFGALLALKLGPVVSDSIIGATETVFMYDIPADMESMISGAVIGAFAGIVTYFAPANVPVEVASK